MSLEQKALNLQKYAHETEPCAFIVHNESSEPFAAAISAKLLAHGFDLLICSVGLSSLREPLQRMYPTKNVTCITLASKGSSNDEQQTLSELLSAYSISITIFCITKSLKTSESSIPNVLPDELFVKLQQRVLPTLIRCSPSAIIFVSDTLGTSESDFFQSYIEGLSRKLLAMGHEETEIRHIEYYANGRNSLLGETRVEVLAQSSIQAIGHHKTHNIPIWSHRLLFALTWFLLCIFPLSFVNRLLRFKY